MTRHIAIPSTDAPMPAAVDRAAFEAEIDALRAREKAHIRQGDAIAAARRRLPMVEVDANLELIGPDGPVTLLDAFEGRTTAARLLLHVAPRQARARAVRRLHMGHHAGAGAVLPAFPRHHLRRLLPGPLRRERPLPRLHGLGHAVVLGTPLARRASRRPHRGHDAHRLLPTRRRPRLRDVLDDAARRRGNGLQPRADGSHGVRTPGAVGGLPAGLAAGVA